MAKVSVIIPNYNHAPYLRQRVDTVLGQTYQDFEVILLDDSSTDESRSIIAEYATNPKIRTQFNEVNSGSTFKQWNKGVRLARGEFVWIAESDDYSDEHFLERLVPTLEADPQVTFVYSRSWKIKEEDRRDGFADWYLADLDSRRWTADFVADGPDECRKFFVRTNPVPNASAVVFRKSVFERVGGADESLRVCGDWKLWAQMAFEGRVGYVGEPLNFNREHGTTVRWTSLQNGTGIREHLAMVRWISGRVSPPQAVLNKAYTWIAALWIPLVLNRDIPFGVRWSVLRDARASDPQATRRVIREIRTRVRLKLAKEFRRCQYLFKSVGND